MFLSLLKLFTVAVLGFVVVGVCVVVLLFFVVGFCCCCCCFCWGGVSWEIFDTYLT